MNEFEESKQPSLSEEQKQYLETVMEYLKVTINECREPLDSKVLGLLEIAHDIIHGQIQMDIYYEWAPITKLDQAIAEKDEDQTFLFIEEDNSTPTKEQLKKWFDE